MLAGAGPSDKPVVDPAAADRGRRVWASECIDCHGTQARGGDKGPNLVRSVIVLRDRYGSQIGPFLKKGHTLQSGTPSANLTDAQIQDLAHFLRQKVNDGLRGSPLFQVQNILTGDAKAGAAFFNGEGKCGTCHASQPRRHRRAARAGRHSAAVPVPGHRPRRARTRRAGRAEHDGRPGHGHACGCRAGHRRAGPDG